MQAPVYSLNTLFDQLGLDDSDEAIDTFIAEHCPIPPELPLHEAPCWNPAQSALLQEAIQQDADWAEVVDTLNALLRK